MSDMAGGQPLSWKVTSTVPYTEVAADGTVVKGHNVSYTTAGGVSGTVFVPATVTDLAQIRDMIAAHAAHLTSVNSLTSGS